MLVVEAEDAPCALDVRYVSSSCPEPWHVAPLSVPKEAMCQDAFK